MNGQIFTVIMFILSNIKKLCEFKYKILLDNLPCGYIVSTWNSKVSSVCKYCNIKESITHMLYECNKIKPIWVIFSNCVSMNIKLSHVILGIRTKDYLSLNKRLCIAIVAYSIFCVWCKSSFDNIQCTTWDIKLEIKKKRKCINLYILHPKVKIWKI